MEERAETYPITDLQQIKALADPLRQRILGAFVAEPRTTKQVATLLGQPPTKLYHHVELLERVGLITLVATRPKRGTTEKYFQAVAQRFTITQESLAGEAATVVEDALSKAFEAAQREVRQTLHCQDAGEPRAIYAVGTLRLAPEHLPILRQRILDLANELGEAAPQSGRETYRYLVAVYPATDEPATE